MTLEMNFGDLEPTNIVEEIEFHRTRMLTFMNEARGNATDADSLVKKYIADQAAYKGSAVIAEAAAYQDPAYKNAVARQQMYDRRTIREATVVTALTNYALLEAARDREARESNIGLKMDGLRELRENLKAYRLKLVRILVKKGAGK